jgi:hypothetical protein
MYVLITSLVYIFILIGAIVDGACLYNKALINDYVSSSVLVFFIILSVLIFIWQCFTCYISVKLFQYIRFNYDGESDRSSSYGSKSSYDNSLSIPLQL